MIEVIDAGFYSSIQDQGRMGYRHLGVPVSGAMDQKAFDLAHQLLGETSDFSCIECTLIGPILRFHEPCSLVLTGAHMQAWVNENPIQNNTTIAILSGDVLKLRRATKGLRTYIKINQAIISPVLLGSTSFYKPLTQDAVLKKGNHIFWIKSDKAFDKSNARIRWDDSYLLSKDLEVEKGPEFNVLSKTVQQQIYQNDFLINSQNRMGYRISSPFSMNSVSMLSGAVRPGTVQITPSGTLLIAGVDGQVSGGYPRIFQLTEEALTVLVQKKEGDYVTFKSHDTLPQKEL
ncbi:MAG: allophanate hydrolase subunit 2 family protein [Flavobacteriaceae bacterium]|nr:allophanate hydrolase subunit 2 family protein [Flavobacteriaceae bacterium]